MDGLGNRVRSLRLSRNLSVRELAEQAGVSMSYVYAIESGVRGSNLKKLSKIASALSVSMTTLIGEGKDDETDRPRSNQ
jgi:transcriptional regulator with XRE-family HTH domain